MGLAIAGNVYIGGTANLHDTFGDTTKVNVSVVGVSPAVHCDDR